MSRRIAWTRLVESAYKVGMAQCDMDCRWRSRCFNERLACRPFEVWVNQGGLRKPSGSFPPLAGVYDRLFPNDKPEN